MGWFDTIKSPKIKSAKKSSSSTPIGLWKKCTNCTEILQTSKLEENFQVCPYCQHHYRLSSKERLRLLIDEGTFESFGDEIVGLDPLKFVDKKPYPERLAEAKKSTGMNEGTLAGTGQLSGQLVSLAIMDFKFMGGSMGVVTGEKVARVMDVALEKQIPCIVVSCSGGARMQEGILSLMQLAKTSASRKKLREAGLPYISVLTDPTTGGVAASFAMVGDLNLAEPKALIGFAGPRVIEQSIKQTLPEGFQRSEFLLDHGFVDAIVPRQELKENLAFFLQMFSK